MVTNMNMVRVWDLVVRIGHWALVIGFFTAYFTEDDFLTQHVWAGYIVGAVVLFRLFWGFVGPQHARFSDFVHSPAVVIDYIKQIVGRHPKRYIGHNPAGGAMVIALLASMAATVYSGLELYAIEENAGPLAAWEQANPGAPVFSSALIASSHADESDDDHDDENGNEDEDEDAEDFWEDLHEFFANLSLLLIVFHVGGVLLASYTHRENLPRAMVTGYKRPEDS